MEIGWSVLGLGPGAHPGCRVHQIRVRLLDANLGKGNLALHSMPKLAEQRANLGHKCQTVPAPLQAGPQPSANRTSRREITWRERRVSPAGKLARLSASSELHPRAS